MEPTYCGHKHHSSDTASDSCLTVYLIEKKIGRIVRVTDGIKNYWMVRFKHWRDLVSTVDLGGPLPVGFTDKTPI